MGSLLFYNNYYNAKLYKIVKDKLYKLYMGKVTNIISLPLPIYNLRTCM